MKMFLRLISYAGLLVMVGGALMVFRNALSMDRYHAVAIVGTTMWFAPLPFWMKRRPDASSGPKSRAGDIQ